MMSHEGCPTLAVTRTIRGCLGVSKMAGTGTDMALQDVLQKGNICRERMYTRFKLLS